MIKICVHCGKEFEARHGNAKYCSVDCRQNARNEQHRRWKENNPEKFRESHRRYCLANRKKCYESCQRWRKANPEKVREYSRRYAANHRNEVIERCRCYYLAHSEDLRERRRRYYVLQKLETERIRKIERLRAKFKATEARLKTQQTKRERHWADDVNFPLVSSCQSTYVY